MSTFKIPLGPFRFMSEDFKKPNWEEKSITKKLRDFASENKGKIREGHISMVLKAAAEVHKHEYRIHQRCRVKKPEDPIHPDPFFVHNGYYEALEDLMYFLQQDSDREGEYDTHTLNLAYRLHNYLWHMLDIWKSMGTDVDKIIIVQKHKEKMQAMAKWLDELGTHPFEF